MTNVPSDSRAAARKRLEEQRGFVPHLIVYLVVNAGLVLVWAMTIGPDGFFWPVFPIVFWGVGIVLHAWSAYFSKPITDADVDEELERMRGESG